jgi:benzylsuccinate CoA-transferase BbsF subunit
VLAHPPQVVGNRDERRAPHDVYRCRGRYEWVAIAVDDDAQFAALAGVIGRPELAAHPRFASAAARRAHAAELDAVIAAWTGERDPLDAARELAGAGVPARAVAHLDAAVASPTLAARRFFTELEHPAVGVRRLAGPPWRASRSPMVAGRAAPCLGQHTRDVLARWLGLAPTAIDELEAAGVLR